MPSKAEEFHLADETVAIHPLQTRSIRSLSTSRIFLL